MTPFLKLVANDIYVKFNGHLENVAVVFPNKRAGMFLNKYLLECSKNAPMWSPKYMTISELFLQNSSLAIGDPILLVSKLYKEYVRPMRSDESLSEYEKSVETLDSFYYWGEMLIKDFDDIDKHLADARQLFANIKELREIGTAKKSLDPEQAKSIEQFFKNFKPEQSDELKDNFLGIWEHLFAIYTNFKEKLRNDGLAYEGMLYRDVIENSNDIALKYDKYVFVGFNALNEVETRLFDFINRQGKALFYWDYDRYYVDDAHNEAGHFMRDNLKRFPGEFDRSLFENLTSEKRVTVVQTANDSAAVRYVSGWLNENLTGNEIETAIVLCDETMLEGTLHAIPEKVNNRSIKQMNVTMGFPITHTPIYGLVKLLVELQTRGWSEKQGAFTHSYVCNVLKHPYIIQCSGHSNALREELLKNKVFYPTAETLCLDELLTDIFTRNSGNAEWLEAMCRVVYAIAQRQNRSEKLYDKLFIEAIFKVYTQCQRLMQMLGTGELNMQQSTLGKLLLRMLSMQSLPFHGEPVVGLQIMGLLETRNLDFKNVILLGVNEGNLPKNRSEVSYVPYNLRRAFGLTLSEHRDSIYAYYFYRLLQRAERVTLVYNNSSESKTRGECSRYVLQLLGSKLYDIERIALGLQQGTSAIATDKLDKTPQMVEILRSRFDTSFGDKAGLMTPSAINKYIECGLKFFFYYVLKIKSAEDVDDSMKDNDFGTVFHYAAELLYDKITDGGRNTLVTESALEYYIKNPSLLEAFIDKAFEKEFFKGNRPVYNGEQYLKREVLRHFLQHLVKMDAEYAPFRYIGSEVKIGMPYKVTLPDCEVSLELGGTIDRIDCKGEDVNIIDYKTGSSDKDDDKAQLDDIFMPELRSAGYRLQAFLYSIVIDEMLSGKTDSSHDCIAKLQSAAASRISPSLLYVHKKNTPRSEFVVKLGKQPVDDITVIKDDYMARLNKVLSEIFDIKVPFTPTTNTKKCEYCDYKEICGK